MNKILLFILLCLCLSVINLLTDVFIFSDDIFYKSFEAQLSANRITELISMHNKWSWLNYALIPLVYIVKLSVVSICLMTGAFIINKPLSFQQSFNSALVAEFVLLIEPLIRVIRFTLFNRPQTFSEVDNFMPLSVSGMLGPQYLQPWEKYCLGTLNLFLVLYVAILIFLLKGSFEGQHRTSAKVVMSGYLPAYFLWVLFITFLSLSIS